MSDFSDDFEDEDEVTHRSAANEADRIETGELNQIISIKPPSFARVDDGGGDGDSQGDVSDEMNEGAADGNEVCELGVSADESTDGLDDFGHREAPVSSLSRKGKPGRRKREDRLKADMTPPDKLLLLTEKRAEKFRNKGKIASALKELIRCTALARIVYGDTDWHLARAHANLAEAYLILKNYPVQACYHTDIAKNVVMGGLQVSESDQHKAEIMIVIFKIFLIQGRGQTDLKKFSDAEKSLQKAESIAFERSRLVSVTQDEIDVADLQVNRAMATLYCRQKKYTNAISYLEKTVDTVEKSENEESVKLIGLYQELGRMEQSQEIPNHERAVELFQKAHSITAKRFQDGSLEMAESAHALAVAYSNTGAELSEASAESYLNESLAICQTQLGPEHEKTLQIQDELARLMIRTERYQGAVSLLRSTFSAKCCVFGDYSEQTADTHKLIGSVYLRTGELEKAVTALRKCLEIEKPLLGANNKTTRETQRTLDVLLQNPSVQTKVKSSSESTMKNRPRFSGSARLL